MTIRIDRVYTRSGDDGETGLAGGGRIGKEAPRVEAYGSLDELNSTMGIIREELRGLAATIPLRSEMEPLLERIQRSLFDLGAYMATAKGKWSEGMPMVGAGDVRILEEEMDAWCRTLSPLRSFILPGGGRIGALLHVARTVCRRAEREAVRLHRVEPVEPAALAYLNRLSDWLFVAARHAAQALGEPESLWREK